MTALRGLAFVLFAAFAALFTMMTSWLIDSAGADRRPPIDIKRMEARNSPIPVGGTLKVRIYRKKVRSCPLTSLRWVVDLDGRQTEITGRSYVKGGPVGTDWVDIDYPIPGSVTAGQYLLRTRIIFHCPEDVYVINQPDVPFRVQ